LNLDNASLQPVWTVAEQLGAAIFVHPWDMLGKERMPNYWLPWLVGMPAETSLAICSMIFGGVFERFPKLRVAFAHGGGAFPFTIGRIEHAFHVRPDLVAIDNTKSPRSYVAHGKTPARFYVDSLVHDLEALRMLLSYSARNVLRLDRIIRFRSAKRTLANLSNQSRDSPPRRGRNCSPELPANSWD